MTDPEAPLLAQLVIRTTVLIKTSPRHAVSHTRRAASFLLRNARGSSRIGSRKAPLVTVSVKTMTIAYVPFGVVEEVVIVTILVVGE